LAWFKKTANDRILKCAASILQQCFVLDCLKLDHGQLNRLDRHIIVSEEGKPTILDFESSSTGRRASNVTSVCQSIFLHGPIFSKLKGSIDKDRELIMKCIRDYKRDMKYEKFEKILSLLIF
jgi:Predicted Ser/Thr protein kinase